MSVFIHIGTDKTGTTSIQHAMNADRLRQEYSINYPSIALSHWAIIALCQRRPVQAAA
jgi:hypothetical protein